MKIIIDNIVSEHTPLAIVDVMMPKMEGITFVMKLRENHAFHVIMLSAKSEEADKIIGLNIGADDYVTKPFRPLELLAIVVKIFKILLEILKNML